VLSGSVGRAGFDMDRSHMCPQVRLAAITSVEDRVGDGVNDLSNMLGALAFGV